MNKLISGNIENVLFFLPSKRWGWRERFLIRSILILQKSGMNCFLVCKKGTRLCENAEINNIRCLYMISLSANLLPGKLYRFYGSILKNYEIDVVHLYSLFHFFTLVWSIKSFPRIPLFLNVLDIEQYGSWNRLKNILLNRVDDIFIAKDTDLKIVSDFFSFPERKIISHNLCINSNSQINFIKNETANKIISVYIDYNHSIDLLDNLFKGIKLFKTKFKQDLFLKIVFDKLNFDRTKLALINSLLENFLEIKYEFIDLTDQLSVDCHVILSKNILDDYTLNLLGHNIPLLVPRGSLLYEQSFHLYKNNFYKEGDLRELTDLLAVNLLGEDKKRYISDNIGFLKKNSEYIFQKVVVDRYRLAREKRMRRYASR